VIHERVYEPFADLYSVVIFHRVFIKGLTTSQSYLFNLIKQNVSTIFCSKNK
jgi:hypothetical protein